MNEKKTDTLLYIILAIAVLIFIYINLFLKWDARGHLNLHWGRDRAADLAGDDCSCGGTERSIELFLKAVNEGTFYMQEADASGGQFAGSPAAKALDGQDDRFAESQASPDGDSRPHQSSDSRDGAGRDGQTSDPAGQLLKEEASSVQFEEEAGEKVHKISLTGYHLYVDLDNLLMYVYKDGEPVKTYEVSGGKPSSPSPIGTWRIISKDTWGEGFGGAWLGFNVPWGKYGIHGTTDPWAVGKTNNSKGCIRMRNKDVQELYSYIPYNTPVTIVYENIPFYPMRDGDRGTDVLNMERALKKLGYYHGSEDGVFGSSLKDAVMKFQKDNKLYVTGVINNSTYEMILQQEREYDEKQKQLTQQQEEERKRLEQELE